MKGFIFWKKVNNSTNAFCAANSLTRSLVRFFSSPLEIFSERFLIVLTFRSSATLSKEPQFQKVSKIVGIFFFLHNLNNIINRGPKERWKCAICVEKILPPGNLALHYEKEHSSFVFNARNVLKTARKRNFDSVKTIKRVIKKPSQSRKVSKQPKPPSNFFPCSICGNSFTNYQRYQKHLKETHEVCGFEIIENSAAIKHFVSASNEAISLNEKPIE